MSDPANVAAPVAPIETAAPVVTEAPVAAPAPAPEPVLVEPVAPAPPATLLGGEPAAQAAEAPAVVDSAAPVTELAAEPSAEAPKTESVAEPPQVERVNYESFAWPEGFTPSEENTETLSAFTTLAGEHRLPQEAAQQLIDLHAAEMQRATTQIQDRLVQRQYDAFHDTVRTWEQDFRADPEFKNRVDTVLDDAKWAVADLSGSPAAAKELNDLLLASGAGNHRAIIRAFANAGKRLREGKPAPRPAPTTGRNGASPADRRYSRGGA